MNQDEDLEALDSPIVVQNQPSSQHQYSQRISINAPINADDLMMQIDPGLSGIIFGKRGVKIKSLAMESGAKISLISIKAYPWLRYVQISGDTKAKEIAQKLINDIIDENKPDNIKQKMSQFISDFDWDQLMKEQAKNLKKRLAALPLIIKDFYKEHPEVSLLTDEEVEDFRLSKNNIIVKYIDENNVKPIPKPVLKFNHAFEDYPEILEEIQKQKFETPSPVQCQAWPIIMSGHDLIAIAQTGTGKTLAFLLPALIHIDFQPTPRSDRKGPSVLVLAPTRELVLQIESEVKKYSYKGIKAMSIYGGASSEEQKECLRNGVEIVIATPGRLNDFVGSGAIDLSDVTFLILDEADRMLDFGFEPQIRVSLLKVRPDRQTIMTSATCPTEIKRLAKSYTTNPIQVTVKSFDLTTVNTVKKDILVMYEEDKEHWLHFFLKNFSLDNKIIIFVNYKVAIEYISSNLIRKGYIVESIHSGREQSYRKKALERFRNGEVSILIATDVVSRGIDINDIKVVINYDFPKDIEEYVHRVGRTGGDGKTGLAITLMTRRDWIKAKELVEVMEKSGQDVPPELQDIVRNFKPKSEKQKAKERRDRSFERRYAKGKGISSRNRRNNK